MANVRVLATRLAQLRQRLPLPHLGGRAEILYRNIADQLELASPLVDLRYMDLRAADLQAVYQEVLLFASPKAAVHASMRLVGASLGLTLTRRDPAEAAALAGNDRYRDRVLAELMEWVNNRYESVESRQAVMRHLGRYWSATDIDLRGAGLRGFPPALLKFPKIKSIIIPSDVLATLVARTSA